jgi:hypothetical protein
MIRAEGGRHRSGLPREEAAVLRILRGRRRKSTKRAPHQERLAA